MMAVSKIALLFLGGYLALYCIYQYSYLPCYPNTIREAIYEIWHSFCAVTMTQSRVIKKCLHQLLLQQACCQYTLFCSSLSLPLSFPDRLPPDRLTFSFTRDSTSLQGESPLLNFFLVQALSIFCYFTTHHNWSERTWFVKLDMQCFKFLLNYINYNMLKCIANFYPKSLNPMLLGEKKNQLMLFLKVLLFNFK